MKISYVIPCYRSDATIQSCIVAIMKQKGNLDKEIIVVDSSPTESLGERIRHYENDDIKYLHSPKQLNPGEARNKGLELADGDFIACLDSDVVLNHNWTRKMLEKHEELSGGNALILLGGSLINSPKTDNYLMNTLSLIEFYAFLSSPRCERRENIPAMNLFFSKKAKCCIRFPSARMAEDIMMCREFTHAGGKIFFVGENWIEHITNHKFIKATYMLGIGSANFRLSTTNVIKKMVYILILVLPVGVIYKYVGILWGLLKYNPSKVTLFLYATPVLFVGLLFYNAGMIRGLINYLIKSSIRYNN